MSEETQTSIAALSNDDEQSIGKSIRRLRWFISTFQKHLQLTASQNGIEFKTDTRVLTKCFLNWIRKFESNRPDIPDHKLPYVGFTSGEMLQELILQKPVSALSLPIDSDSSRPEYFWPEGYIYVSYCLEIRRAVTESDFQSTLETSTAIHDIKLWWTFKENVLDNSRYAIPFLDRFSGDDNPDWDNPGLFNGTKRLTNLQRIIPNTPMIK